MNFLHYHCLEGNVLETLIRMEHIGFLTEVQQHMILFPLYYSNNKRPQPGLALLCKANYKQRVPAPTHRQCGEEESTDVDLRTQTFSGSESCHPLPSPYLPSI